MNTYIQKITWMQLIVGLSCILGLLFTANAHADNTAVADIDTAYSYYSGLSDSNPTPIPEQNDTIMENVLPPPASTTAPQGAAGGLGGIANNLMEPVGIIASFLVSVALVAGFSCLFAGFIRYMQHRTNPLAHPISTVVTLVVLGLVLLLLPLIYKLTESGIPFTLQ